MRQILEHFSLMLVGILSIILIYLIVQYNLIDDEVIIESVKIDTTNKPEKLKIKAKTKTNDYLKNMETYRDVDVSVSKSKNEINMNTVKVKSEVKVTNKVSTNSGHKDKVGDALDNLLQDL